MNNQQNFKAINHNYQNLTINAPINTQLNTQPHHETRNSPPQSHHQTEIPESSRPRNQTPTQQNIPRSFLYTETDIHEGLSACNRSIIGKTITDKPIHVNSIQNGLENIWGSPPGLKIQEVGGKVLQFFMHDPTDQDRILQGNPWIFHNSWLVVKPWDRETDIQTIDFDHVPIWIQLWGLPPHCKTKQMGESIGALMGNVEASEFYEYPGKKVIIKIKVAIDVHNPITSGIHVGNPTDGTNWIDYRYEKLPQMCFKCGMIGHMDKLCRNQPLELDTLAPLGPWIRSTQYGKRKMEEKDRKYYSNPSQSKNFGHYSPPVPADLLEKLAAMRVQPTRGSQTNQPTQQQSNPVTAKAQATEEREKKAHKLSINNATMQQDHHTNLDMQGQSNIVKRQKIEDNTRVGTAQQASPQP
jgi:hypothetical protein